VKDDNPQVLKIPSPPPEQHENSPASDEMTTPKSVGFTVLFRLSSALITLIKGFLAHASPLSHLSKDRKSSLVHLAAIKSRSLPHQHRPPLQQYIAPVAVLLVYIPKSISTTLIAAYTTAYGYQTHGFRDVSSPFPFLLTYTRPNLC